MFCWPGTPHHLKQEFYLESTGPKCQFRFGKRYWGDLKLLYNKSWNFDFSVLYDPLKVVDFGKFCQNIAIFEPKFHIKILSPPTKINLEIWKLACMTYRCVSKTKSAFLEIFIFLTVMALQILKNWPKIPNISTFWLPTHEMSKNQNFK